MNEKFQKILNKATDYSGSGKRKVTKGIIGAVIIILLGVLGLEASNNDWDLSSIFSGASVSDSKVMRDEKGNVVYTQLVPETVNEPDYDPALAAVK